MISLLIYYDRVEDKKKEYLSTGLMAFFLSYLLLSYTKKVILSALCLLVSLFLIAYGISDMGLYSYKNQYIYLSLFMIFVSLVFFDTIRKRIFECLQYIYVDAGICYNYSCVYVRQDTSNCLNKFYLKCLL